MPLCLEENSLLNAWDGFGLSKPVDLSIPTILHHIKAYEVP